MLNSVRMFRVSFLYSSLPSTVQDMKLTQQWKAFLAEWKLSKQFDESDFETIPLLQDCVGEAESAVNQYLTRDALDGLTISSKEVVIEISKQKNLRETTRKMNRRAATVTTIRSEALKIALARRISSLQKQNEELRRALNVNSLQSCGYSNNP